MSGPAGRVTRGAGKDTAGFGGGTTGAPPADMLRSRCCLSAALRPPPLPGSRRRPAAWSERRGEGRGRAPGWPRPVTWAQVSAPPPAPRAPRAQVRPPPGAVPSAALSVPAAGRRPAPLELGVRSLGPLPGFHLPPATRPPGAPSSPARFPRFNGNPASGLRWEGEVKVTAHAPNWTGAAARGLF